MQKVIVNQGYLQGVEGELVEMVKVMGSSPRAVVKIQEKLHVFYPDHIVSFQEYRKNQLASIAAELQDIATRLQNFK